MIHLFWSKKVKILKNNKITKLLFQLISLRFYSNFEWDYFLDAKFNSSSKQYPCCILMMDPPIWKTWLQSHFSCIFHFSCRRVHQNYATWVLIGWGIKFCIQRVPPLEIWVTNLGDKLKIWLEKVVLLFYYFKIFLPFYFKNGESSTMGDIIILNPTGSYKFYFYCTFFWGGPF